MGFLDMFFFLFFELDIPSGVNDYIFFCLMSKTTVLGFCCWPFSSEVYFCYKLACFPLLSISFVRCRVSSRIPNRYAPSYRFLRVRYRFR